MKIKISELQNDMTKISFEVIVEKSITRKFIGKIYHLVNENHNPILENDVTRFAQKYKDGIAIENMTLLHDFRTYFNNPEIDIKKVYRTLRDNGIKFNRSNTNGSRKITFIC